LFLDILWFFDGLTGRPCSAKHALASGSAIKNVVDRQESCKFWLAEQKVVAFDKVVCVILFTFLNQ
jgi:hypothetical protein